MRIINGQGQDVLLGAEGELLVRGGNVFVDRKSVV